MPLKPHPTDPNMMVYVKHEYNPPKEWQGLDTSDFNDFNPYFKAEEAARWAERKLKEKNT